MTKRIFLKMFLPVALTFFSVNYLSSQVTIGAIETPSSFSVLELIGNNAKGLRLPQMDSIQRKALEQTAEFIAEKTGKAMGLQIFNTDIRCIETWNGAVWIRQCPPSGPYAPPPHLVIPPGKGGGLWGTTQWVGAFWKDNQTGERIIASPEDPSNPGALWTATVDPACDWLVLEANGGYDPGLGTVAPGDAESYQVQGNATSVSGTGDILFRIGVTGTDTRTTTPDHKYPDGSDGKAPRYATVTLTVDGIPTPYILYCRQGEAADYVFTQSDTYNDPDHTAATNILRLLAKKFSPYNLTDATLSESVTSHQAGYQGGSFVDYPTKAGAFFQWGQSSNETYAYHPAKPVGATSPWTTGNTSTYWDDMKTDHETCPDGWRRPNDGVTDALQTISNSNTSTSDYTSNNIYLSEMRQSLYAVPKNGITQTTGRALGYYADGYFDRRPIVASATGEANTAVSPDTKDVAYIGVLFFNAANGNRSLFAPAAGVRDSRSSRSGSLGDSGFGGKYWSSSSSMNNGISLTFYSIYTFMLTDLRSNGFCVRCVAE